MKCRYFLNKKGEKIGEETIFLYDGVKNKTQTWEDGKLNGIATIFYKTGEKYIQSSYKDNKRNGEYTIYAKNGVVLQACIYQNGEKIAESSGLVKNIPITLKPLGGVAFNSIIKNDIRQSYDSSKSDYKKIMADIEKEELEREQRHGFMKAASVVLGGQAIHDKLTIDKIVKACNEYHNAAVEATNRINAELNRAAKDFGMLRLDVMSKTTGRFLGFLKRLKRKNAVKEYEMLSGVGVDIPTLEKMQLDSLSGKQLTAAAGTGAVLAVALRGAAPVVLGAFATGALALGGIVLTAHFASKRTETEEERLELEKYIAGLERQWVEWDGVNKRIAELRYVTQELEQRVSYYLDILEPLIIEYDSENQYYLKVFQETGMLIKSITELLQTPLLDDNEQLSDQSAHIIQKTNKILNTEFINYD